VSPFCTRSPNRVSFLLLASRPLSICLQLSVPFHNLLLISFAGHLFSFPGVVGPGSCAPCLSGIFLFCRPLTNPSLFLSPPPTYFYPFLSGALSSVSRVGQAFFIFAGTFAFPSTLFSQNLFYLLRIFSPLTSFPLTVFARKNLSCFYQLHALSSLSPVPSPSLHSAIVQFE